MGQPFRHSGHPSSLCTTHTPAPRRYSEQSRTKCIGMTIETRPDFCLTPHLSQMLSYGCTRLEIGLQVGADGDARGRDVLVCSLMHLVHAYIAAQLPSVLPD